MSFLGNVNQWETLRVFDLRNSAIQRLYRRRSI